MKHYDGKGHHPKVRLYVPHGVVRLIMKVTQNMPADDMVQQEEMVVEMVGGTPYAYYVDNSGYGMLQANEAEPPPANDCDGLAWKASEKTVFKFLASLRRIAAVVMVLVSILSVATSCGKEPQPQPEPTKNITIDMTWHDIFQGLVNRDTISYYAKQPDVKTVTLQIEEKPTDSYEPRDYRRARDTLQTRFDISPKVVGSGTIFVSRQGGAQLPDLEHGIGMAEVDSIWYAMHGFKIERFKGYDR